MANWLKVFKKHSKKPAVEIKVIDFVEQKIRTTKSEQVKNHLLRKGTITSWQAIKLYGATRLSAIIFNLRKAGYCIDSTYSTGVDRNKNKSRFAIYKLIK